MDLTLLVWEIQTNSKIYFTQIVIQSQQTEQQEPMYCKSVYLCMSIKKNLKLYTTTCSYWLVWK